MQSSDLAGLFAASPTAMGASSSTVMGTIITFSYVDGSNTVDVLGATLTNVPMLLTGAEVNYVPGDSVMLLILGNTYLLIGKIAVVGSSQFGSASIAAYSNGSSVNSYTYGTGGVLQSILTTTVPAPAWATFAVISLLSVSAFQNNGASDADLEIQNYLQGGYAGGGVAYAAHTHNCQVTGVAAFVYTLTGTSTLTASTSVECPFAGTGGYSQLSMSALYYK